MSENHLIRASNKNGEIWSELFLCPGLVVELFGFDLPENLFQGVRVVISNERTLNSSNVICSATARGEKSKNLAISLSCSEDCPLRTAISESECGGAHEILCRYANAQPSTQVGGHTESTASFTRLASLRTSGSLWPMFNKNAIESRCQRVHERN